MASITLPEAGVSVRKVGFRLVIPAKAGIQGRGGRLIHGKTSWTLYYEYAKQDNEKTLVSMAIDVLLCLSYVYSALDDTHFTLGMVCPLDTEGAFWPSHTRKTAWNNDDFLAVILPKGHDERVEQWSTSTR